MILSVLDANWDFINEQISRTFKGEKIKVKDLGKQTMCKNKNIKVGIKKLDFTTFRGKMMANLTDGRQIIVPLSFFQISKK